MSDEKLVAACREARRQFALYLYGELSFDAEEQVEAHLDACQACRAALDHQRALHAAFDGAAVEPPASLLRECRENLRDRLARESAPAPIQPRWWNRLAPALAMPPLARVSGLRPVGAVALLAAGFFGARVLPWPGGYGSMAAVAPGAARVRFIEPASDGRIQIVFDETRQRTITGAPDDAAIRRLLLSTAKDSADPGLRVETLAILNARAQGADVRDALLYAVEHDPNAGVRLKALEGLRPFAGQREVHQVLARVLLGDENPGMRTQAIDLLTAGAEREFDRQVVGALQELMGRESNDYVRQRGLRLLEAVSASAEIY
jgi:hypothetical protein